MDLVDPMNLDLLFITILFIKRILKDEGELLKKSSIKCEHEK
jgi:hypothetical protein